MMLLRIDSKQTNCILNSSSKFRVFVVVIIFIPSNIFHLVIWLFVGYYFRITASRTLLTSQASSIRDHVTT